MRIREIPYVADRAEGICHGLSYNTELASRDGCSIHFWVANDADKQALPAALHKARNARDIVSATWCTGQPTGYWANQNID